MKRHSVACTNAHKYINQTQNGRTSVRSLPKSYLSHARPSLHTPLSYEEEQNLLETTSVADLIRALEKFHSDSVKGPNSVRNRHQQKRPEMPRKSSLLTLLHRRHHSSHTIHTGPTADSAIKRTRLYSCGTERDRGRFVTEVNPFVRQQSPSSYPPPPYSSPSPASVTNSDLINSTLKRRFSVRPANLDKAPGQFHKEAKYPSPVTQPKLSSV